MSAVASAAAGAAETLCCELVGADEPVPLADGRQARYVHLDHAASTPALRQVLDAVNRFMPWYAAVHRGAGYKSQGATRAFEAARERVGRFVGASPAEHLVIFGKNATEAINKLAHRMAFGADDVVIVSTLEHHSNDLPWRARARVERIGCDALGRLDEQHAEDLLRRHAGRVRLLAVTGASNVTGHLPRIHHLAELAHAAGARILVDAAQLAPHRRVDMRAPDDPAHLDYVAFSAHKMYAPFGTGVLVGRRDTFGQGAPEYRGGGTVRAVSVDEVLWADAPERDEAGSPNVVGVVALAAAMDALEALGFEAIAAHEALLTARLLRGLRGIEGLRVHGDTEPDRAAQRLGVVPFALRGLPHARVAARLSAEHGIGVRSGCFCAHPYLTALLGLSGAEVSQLHRQLATDDHRRVPGLVRASLGLGSSAADVDRLLQGLREIAATEGA